MGQKSFILTLFHNLHKSITFSHLMWDACIRHVLKDLLNQDIKTCYFCVRHWIYLYLYVIFPLWFPKSLYLNLKNRAPKQKPRNNFHEFYTDICLCYTIVLQIRGQKTLALSWFLQMGFYWSTAMTTGLHSTYVCICPTTKWMVVMEMVWAGKPKI